MTFRVAGLAATAFALILLTPQVHGAAQRTFVATTGVPNPACSRVAPCRAFSEALAATSPGGEIVALDSGGYGSFTITQAVSIVAPPGIYAGISVFGGDGITINAGASDVVKLRGLTLNGLGGVNGIKVNTVGLLEVDDVRATGFSLRGLYFAANGHLSVTNSVFDGNGESGLVAQLAIGLAVIAIDRSRFDRNVSNGVVIGANAMGNIARSSASHNPSVGFLIDDGAVATLADCRTAYRYELIGNSYGIMVRGAGTRATISRCDVFGAIFGFAAVNGARVQVTDSSAQSGGAGFVAQYNASEMFLERSTAANNTKGITTVLDPGSTAKVHLSNCAVTGNSWGVDVGFGGTVESRGNNTIRGNTFGDVTGGGTFTGFGAL